MGDVRPLSRYIPETLQIKNTRTVNASKNLYSPYNNVRETYSNNNSYALC